MDRERRAEHALSREEIERFVDRGYLLLRGCFSPEAAARVVDEVFTEGAETIRRVEGRPSAGDPREIDLTRPETWSDKTRIELVTGKQLSIASFAPRLWGAITSLIGPRHRIVRRTIGENWFVAPPRVTETAAGEPRRMTKAVWHIDAVSERSTLDGRTDALLAVILWTDVEPDGGGTLFSGKSIEGVVRYLEAHSGGVDTRGTEWARTIVRGCGDARELTGKAGDALVAHGLTLHAAHWLGAAGLRVYENPMITVEAPLGYFTDDADPSPVERVVLERLARPRPRPRDRSRGLAERLIDAHPDYFVPSRQRWRERVGADGARAVSAIDNHLTGWWVDRVLHRVCRDRLDRLDMAYACVGQIRDLVVDARTLRAELPESIRDRGFPDATWSRLLRGLMTPASHNHLLGLLLAGLFDEVRLVELVDRATDRVEHTLLRVRWGEAWFFADVRAAAELFYVSAPGAPAPPGVPEHGAIGHGPDRGLYPRARYERDLRDGPRVEAPTPVAALPDVGGAAPPPALDPWRTYLRVRLQHVLTPRPGTAEAYRELARQHRLGGLTGRLVRALAERASHLDRRGPTS